MLTAEQLNYIRGLLNKELEEVEERNRERVSEMESRLNDSETFHGDEADQANFMEERNRQLRMMDCDIDFERLKVRPVASLCIECKKEADEREERERFSR